MSRITAQDMSTAVGTYVEQELIPKSSGAKRLLLYAAIPVIMAKGPQMVEQYKPMLQLLDAVNDDGTIELEPVYNSLKTAMHKAGTVHAFGIIFDEKDMDKVFSLAQQFSR